MHWKRRQEFLSKPKCLIGTTLVCILLKKGGRTSSSSPRSDSASTDSRITPRKNLNLDLCLIKYFNPLLEQGSGPKIVKSCMVLRREHEVYNLDLWNNMKYLKKDARKTTKNCMKRFSYQRAWEQSQSMTKELRRQFHFFRSLSVMSNSYLQYHILAPCALHFLYIVKSHFSYVRVRNICCNSVPALPELAL